jgi:hypothetical protein
MKAIVLGMLLLFGSVSLACGMGNKEIIFRPATLKVFDSEIKQPLEGISVKVVNITFNPKRKMFQGLVIEQEDRDKHRLYSYQTNADGVVEIPQYKYKVTSNNFLHSQYILINIDVIGMSKREIEKEGMFDAVVLYSREGDKFYRLKSDYKAGRIASYPYPSGIRHDYQLEKTKPYYTEVINYHDIPPLSEKELRAEPTSLFCDYEEFNFYLERFVFP